MFFFIDWQLLIFRKEYIYFFFFLVICYILVFILWLISWLFGQTAQNTHTLEEKLTAYECGFDPFQESHSIFDVKFHLLAILFIIFDLELIYFLPWALLSHSITIINFCVFFFFFMVLLFGFFYEWLIGVLDWA
jgi:NADH:ubiquinone oxidoreductase subunit 3 (subunit A)